MSSRLARLCVIAAGTAFFLLTQTAAEAQSGAPAGRLTCQVGSGIGMVVTSQRPMDCRFAPRRGPVQRYTGVVRNFGLDLGSIRGSTMSWRVYGPYARTPAGALNGRFGGATAGASVVAGASANILVGGRDNSVSLQPLSIQSARGINLAVGVTGFELTYVPPRRR